MNNCNWTGGYLLVACDRPRDHLCHTALEGRFYDNVSCHEFKNSSEPVFNTDEDAYLDAAIEDDGYVTVYPKLPV